MHRPKKLQRQRQQPADLNFNTNAPTVNRPINTNENHTPADLNINTNAPTVNRPINTNENHTPNPPPAKRRRCYAFIKRRKSKAAQEPKLRLSNELAKFTGQNTMRLSELGFCLWNHIKVHNLQDPTNKEKIICDEPLREIFKERSEDLTMYNIHQCIRAQVGKKEVGDQIRFERQRTQPPHMKEFLSGRHELPKPLAEFFSVSTMSRTESLKRMFEYLRTHNIPRDPERLGYYLCDERMKRAFGKKSISPFGLKLGLKLASMPPAT